MKDADVVSFDFFDTLFMRSVCAPGDVFSLLWIAIKDKWEITPTYIEIRKRAQEGLRSDYSFDELYDSIQAISGITNAIKEHIKDKEIEIEKRLIAPRNEVISVLRSAVEAGKEVYIVSDMYLPKDFYEDILERYGIAIPEDHILLSNILNMSKKDGSIWKYYAENIVKDRKALHIGDNAKTDVENPQKQGIKAYYTPSAWELLSFSTIKNISSYICNDYDTAVMGCILKEMFGNPYRFENTEAIVKVRNNYEMGYCIFAPVIMTFLLWLLEISRKDGIKKLVFMSRDGYFLKEDFDYLCGILGEERESCYLGISRQLAMSASIENRNEIIEYVLMPYSGNIEEMFEDRFGIKGIKEDEGKNIEEYINEYITQIEKNLAGIRESYKKYIGMMQLDNDCAVVDLGFYGNNQRYLNKLLHKSMRGYYFNANLSEQNENVKLQKMTACFQKDNDLMGENSNVLKKQIYLESFLTAPYGMVKAVDCEGNFICADKKKNQEHFKEKEEINRGVKKFIYDYLGLFKEFKLSPDTEFVDRYYGCCFSGAVEFDDEVKQSFYNDNAMMNRIESMLFY